MSPRGQPEELSEASRQEIYLALAEAQDLHEFTPAQARQLISGRFGVSEAQLRRIEHEGQERLWPTA
jgi:hypothetical protein